MVWITKLLQLFVALIGGSVQFHNMIGIAIVAGVMSFIAWLMRKLTRYSDEFDKA